MKLLCAVLLLFTSHCIWADNFRFALADEEYPPYYFKRTDNQGILNKIITQFADTLAYKIDFVYVPKMRSAKLLAENLIDARVDSKLWQIDKNKYYWSDEIVTLEDVIIVGRGLNPADFKDKNKLNNTVLLARFGYVYPQYEQLINAKVIHREMFYSDRAILKSLYNDTQMGKRFAVMSRDAFNWYSDKEPKLKALNISEFHVGRAPLQLQFRYTAKGKKLVTEFNLFLKKLKDNGELARMIRSYQ